MGKSANHGNKTDDKGDNLTADGDPGSLRVSQEDSAPPINEVVGSVASSRFRERK